MMTNTIKARYYSFKLADGSKRMVVAGSFTEAVGRIDDDARASIVGLKSQPVTLVRIEQV